MARRAQRLRRHWFGSMSRLSDLQATFLELQAVLLVFASSYPGFRVRAGEMHRLPAASWGHRSSTHKLRLAFDVIVDRWQEGRWVYQTGDCELYLALDRLWLVLGELRGVPTRTGRPWGDYNHFSIEWNGVK